MSEKDSALREMYHRVQNTLQTLISYLNIMSADRDGAEKEWNEKLVKFIHLLNFFQRNSLDQIELGNDEIGLDQVIRKTVELFAEKQKIELADIPEFFGTYKEATALGMILYEVLDNAVHHGDGAISITLDMDSSGKGVLNIANPMKVASLENSSPEKAGAGIRLVKLLGTGHLRSQVEFNVTSGPHLKRRMTASIPLNLDPLAAVQSPKSSLNNSS